MSLRNFVTGSDVCAPSDSQRRSNAVGSVAEAVLQRTRANERARQGGATSSNVQNFFENSLTPEEREKDALGVVSEDARWQHQVGHCCSKFEVKRMMQEGKGQVTLSKPFEAFDHIFSDLKAPREVESAEASHVRQERDRAFSEAFHQIAPPPLDVELRDAALTQAFKSFLNCARDDVPFGPIPFPDHLWFDPIEKQKVSARVQHLCRVVFVDHGHEVADTQASRFLECLRVGAVTSSPEAFHKMWDASKPPVNVQQQYALSSNWMDQFSKLYLDYGMPQQRQPAFAQKQQASSSTTVQEKNEAKDIHSELIRRMENDPDPKFRNSKFLQFVQKLNSGALVIEGDQVRESSKAEQWAAEFAAQYPRPQQQSSERQAQTPWEEMFRNASGREDLHDDRGVLEGGWLETSEIQEWVENYQQMAYGPIEEDREYVFAASNPFLGNPEALSLGTDFFARGNLSEAVLAVEAEVQRSPENIDAWILLGKVHAENDNDPQAIAALNRAKTLDPSHLAVLLDLGVCHANELHEQKTVEAMMSWLHQHPLYQSHPALASKPQGIDFVCLRVECGSVILSDTPSDADVFVALGVLHHLGRNFEEAISLFNSAVQLRPDDYTLWNKLGATQANAAKSGDAIAAYQKALEQKPNYMRGWANLGISYANLGDYITSVHHYVRALSLNPNAETVWGYLKSSAICAGLTDVLEAIEGRQLNLLKTRFSQT